EEDLAVAEAVLGLSGRGLSLPAFCTRKRRAGTSPAPTTMFRIGIGHDTHRLVASRPLVLGGVVIPFDRGSDGHSDGDALTHAIADAMLGALCEGDLGLHFPDTD